MSHLASLFLLGVATPAPTAAPSTLGAGLIGFSFLLSTVIWAPVLVAVILATVPNPRGRYDRFMLLTAFWTNVGMLLLTLIGYQQFQLFASGVQFEEKLPWLPALGVTYHLGVDGIGISLLLLSSLVGVASVLAATGVRERAREFFVLLLLAQAGINGVIAARDFFVLVLFWSAASVPVALLVAGWGSAAPGGLVARLRGARRLLAFWGLGSAALLVAGLLLYSAAGSASFDFDYLLKGQPAPRIQIVIGGLLLVAAATRLPLFPLHGWGRDVLAEAQPGVAVLIAGLECRLGALVLIRLLPGATPDAARTLAPFIAAIGAITVGYAALAALRAGEIRRMGAYLALIPGGLTVLGVGGLTPLALTGAVLSLFAGGLAAALIVGVCATIAERAEARSFSVLAGLGPRTPRLAWLFVVAGLAVLGAPFLATFLSSLMIVLGSAQTQPAWLFVAAAGVVLAVVTVAWAVHRVMFGAPNPDAPTPADSSLSESWYLGILVGALIWVGLVPGGPKLAQVPLFDPGLANVVSQAAADLAAPFAIPSPSPPATPAPSSTPSISPAPSPSASP